MDEEFVEGLLRQQEEEEAAAAAPLVQEAAAAEWGQPAWRSDRGPAAAAWRQWWRRGAGGVCCAVTHSHRYWASERSVRKAQVSCAAGNRSILERRLDPEAAASSS